MALILVLLVCYDDIYLRTKDRIITEPVTVPNVILTQPWNVYVEGRYVYTHMDATFSWLKTE